MNIRDTIWEMVGALFIVAFFMYCFLLGVVVAAKIVDLIREN